ncbi:MAG: ATP-binding cassette domain-containing protein [Legionellales bacterium]|nr:ATP-binding cassette domain-containing protein [Legionellales bacterium]
MIDLNNINVFFNKGTQIENRVLKDINCKINRGDFITVVGGNGAGKSTLMNIIRGGIFPTSGNILIDGEDMTRFPLEKRSGIVANIFQDPMFGTFSELTIEENLHIAYMRGKKRGLGLFLNSQITKKYISILAELGIGIEHRLKDKVAFLSGGQRQALSLAMATLQKSKILILDEHTAALDHKSAKKILLMTSQIISENNLTALMITHKVQEALFYGNRTIVLHSGRIIKDIYGTERLNLSANDLLALFDKIA